MLFLFPLVWPVACFLPLFARDRTWLAIFTVLGFAALALCAISLMRWAADQPSPAIEATVIEWIKLATVAFGIGVAARLVKGGLIRWLPRSWLRWGVARLVDAASILIIVNPPYWFITFKAALPLIRSI